MKRLLLIGLCLLPFPAFAQQQCAPFQVVRDQLSERYSESAVYRGMDEKGRMLEVFSSAEGKTWTIIVTSSTGISCLLSAGEGWEAVAAEARKGQGS